MAVGLVWWLSVAAATPAAATGVFAPPAGDDVATDAASRAAAAHRRVTTILENLERTQDWDEAVDAVEGLYAEILAYVPATETEAYYEAALARRLILAIAETRGLDRMDLLRFFKQSPRLAEALGFTLRPGDDANAVMTLLNRFRRERPDLIEPWANVVAAICVVHDRDNLRSINEASMHAPDPMVIFDFYVRHEGAMNFPLRDLSPDLLVFVVNWTTTLDDMEWALRKYRGKTSVGKLYHDIEYDYEHLETGKPKASVLAGYSLPAILRHGGICADQAYFAESVGKAIGVPTAFIRGRGAEMAHAWVGYLEKKPQQGLHWNVSEGRWAAYWAVRGSVTDPQDGTILADSDVALRVETALRSPGHRMVAEALADAAEVLRNRIKLGRVLLKRPTTAPYLGDNPIREATPEAVLALARAAVERNLACRRAWVLVVTIAPTLSGAQRAEWARAIHEICGESYHDFVYDTVCPLIESVEKPESQEALWDLFARRFRGRADLEAGVRMRQANLRWRQGEPIEAGKMFEAIAHHYANAGPFAVDALSAAEQILLQMGARARLIQMYELAWRRSNPPERRIAREFGRQSNWYRIGKRLERLYREAGQGTRAQAVASMLEQALHPEM